MILKSADAELRAVMDTADLMLAAARTAPKACGKDNLEAFALTGEEKRRLTEAMKRYGKEKKLDFVVRDAILIDYSPVIVFLGAIISPMRIPDCGFCGFQNCGDCVKHGGRCAFNVTDLGIAVGSAVSIAADRRIDNRVLYSAGKVALEIGLFSDRVKAAYGIPLSTSCKNPYFDRESEDNKAVERKVFL